MGLQRAQLEEGSNLLIGILEAFGRQLTLLLELVDCMREKILVHQKKSSCFRILFVWMHRVVDLATALSGVANLFAILLTET